MSSKGVTGRSRGYKGAKPWRIGSHVDVRDNEAYHRDHRVYVCDVHVHSVMHVVDGWLDGSGAELKV